MNKANNSGDADVATRIAQQQARLDAQRRELEETHATLTSREAELDALQLELDRRQAEMEQHHREISQSNRELSAAREEIKRLNESLQADQTDQHVDRLAELYRQQQAEIEGERERIRQSADQVQQERAALADQAKQLEEGRSEIERRTASLADRQEQLQAERGELDRQREQLDVERSELARDHEELDAAQADQSRLRDQLEREQLEARGQLDRLTNQQEQLDEQRTHLEAEQAALASRSAGIEKQREALSAQRAELVTRQEQLETEHEQLREACERSQVETETHRAELREKVDQFNTQLTQVTERWQELSVRQQAVEERERTVEESERQAAQEQAERRAELDAERQELDERRDQTEAEEARLDVDRKECDQRSTELSEHMTAFSADREHILGVQSQFDARTEALDERDEHLDRVEAELNQQREQLEERRVAVQAKETALTELEVAQAEREAAVSAAEEELASRQAALREEAEALAQQAEALASHESGLPEREQTVAQKQEELQVRATQLEQQTEQLDADREQFDRDRQEAARGFDEDRRAIEQQREELAERVAGLAERERRLAEAVASLEDETGDPAAGGAETVIVETVGFNLRKTLIISLLMAGISAMVAVGLTGFQHRVEGRIRLDTEADPGQALAQHAAMIYTPGLIEAAAQNLDADMSSADLAAMLDGRDIKVTTSPEDREIRLVSVTEETLQAVAVIDALGQALVRQIQSKTTTTEPSEERVRLEDELTAARGQLAGDMTRLDQAKQALVATSEPSVPIAELEAQWQAAEPRRQESERAWLDAKNALAEFEAQPATFAVDAATLRQAVTADPEHRRGREQLAVRAGQLRGILLDGLDGVRVPMSLLSERIEAFDAEVAARLKDKPADDLAAALARIQKELATCRGALTVTTKTRDDLSKALRDMGDAVNADAALTGQQQAETLLAGLVDRLREPITEIHKQVQAVADVSAEDMTRRIVIQDALRKQAEELTLALRGLANASADVIPASNQQLDACLGQIRQLGEALAERERLISAGMETRAKDRAAQQRANRLAELRKDLAEKTEARDRALGKLLSLTRQLVEARSQEARRVEATATVEHAEEIASRSAKRVETAEAQIAAFENRAGAMLASSRQDRATIGPTMTSPGLANRAALFNAVIKTATLVFGLTWLVSYLASGGRGAGASRRDADRGAA